MPRERVQHGKLWVAKTVPSESVIDIHGEPTGAHAYELRDFIPGEILAKDEVLYEEPSLDVAWNRDAGWVQIGIDAPKDWWDRFFEGYRDHGDTPYAVYTETLTRQQINKMIATLRRARDAAYGRDE